MMLFDKFSDTMNRLILVSTMQFKTYYYFVSNFIILFVCNRHDYYMFRTFGIKRVRNYNFKIADCLKNCL